MSYRISDESYFSDRIGTLSLLSVYTVKDKRQFMSSLKGMIRRNHLHIVMIKFSRFYILFAPQTSSVLSVEPASAYHLILRRFFFQPESESSVVFFLYFYLLAVILWSSPRSTSMALSMAVFLSIAASKLTLTSPAILRVSAVVAVSKGSHTNLMRLI